MIIKLNNILNLTEEEISNCKIGLNMSWAGKDHFTRWYESDEDKKEVSFAYHSHQGGKRNFKENNLYFGFVRLPEKRDHWLLITAGTITYVPETPGTCGYKTIEKYAPFIGRLIINYHKENTFSRYIFNMDKIIDKAIIQEILPNIYEPIKFDGFENVHLSYKTLKDILDTERYQEYRGALKGVKAIYCLTDNKTGKLYIGSATGENGVLQRWEEYMNTKTGGNVGLIDLYNKKGPNYFEDNMWYSILEIFEKNVNREKILKRETHWKEVFCTRDNGYNKN